MRLKSLITLCCCMSALMLACEASKGESEMMEDSSFIFFKGGSVQEGGESITQPGLPVGSACEESYDCQSTLCFTAIEASFGVCVSDCSDESEVCGVEFICRDYQGYGSICVPDDRSYVEPSEDMDPSEDIGPSDDIEPPKDARPLDEVLEPSEVDMMPLVCQSRDVIFTHSDGLEVGRVTLTEPQQSVEVALSSLKGRTNRARVIYNRECTDLSVELLEQYNTLCFDFSRQPCERIPDQNCTTGVVWSSEGRSVMISEDTTCDSTPEGQGWVQYHTQIESCFPMYNGPEVNRFYVEQSTFPPCDDSVRGQHWCISSEDGSPSGCQWCEGNLYMCR